MSFETIPRYLSFEDGLKLVAALYILSFETIARYRKRLHGNGKILLPLPWDGKARGKNETAPAPQPTKEEARARFAALVAGS